MAESAAYKGSSGIRETRKDADFLGLDRKQMEAERLARLRRKRGSISPPAASRHHKVSPPLKDLNHVVDYSAGKALANSHGGVSEDNSAKYLDGVVKKTAVKGFERSGDDISFSEIIEPTLQLAVFSSYQWDMPWLFSKFSTSKTLTTLVMQAKDEETKSQYRRETSSDSHLRLCFPKMDGGFGVMHSKLMLLSYPHFLRVVVPTANLVPYDWGETGTMENMVFLIDLPRLSGSSGTQTPFSQELAYFLTAKGIEPSIIQSLQKFDFSRTNHLAFVHTIAGSHIGEDDPWQRTGHCGLARAVSQLSLSNHGELQIDYVTSSLGALKAEFLSTLSRSCHGHQASPPTSTTRMESKSKSQTKLTNSDPPASQTIQIYFPTSHTVKTSKARSAGTICLSSKHFHSPDFLRHLLRNTICTRPGILMHTKLLLVQPRQTDHESIAPSWAYLGSANCTESAWGNAKLVRDRSTGRTKLYARNWECGVVFAVKPDSGSGTETERQAEEGNGDVKGIKKLKLPIPMQFPGPAYADGEEPWFFDG